MATVLAWYTWGHWGDVQIDCGREMYVPVAILKGNLIYRDFWYQYGPLPPYLQALAFMIFGINLNTLYVLGMISVVSAALLLFEIGRNFELVLPAAMTPALFFLVESFRPTIFNFIFPYSYAAPLAAVFGLACLYSTIQHARTGRQRWLLLAALYTSLALLTKQEFGLACLAVLGFETIASCLNGAAWSDLISNGFASAVGLIPAVFVYAALVWKISAKTIFIDNWVMTPGTYTMRTIGAYRMAHDGMRFGLNEWSKAALGAAMSVLLWFLIAYANAFTIRKLGFHRLRYFIFVVVADIAAALVVNKLGNSAWNELPMFIAQIVFPKGVYLIGCAFTIVALWKVWRTRGRANDLAEALLGIYAVTAGLRVMMEMFPARGYAVFFNGAIFVVFVIVVTRVVTAAAQSLDGRRRNTLVGCMLSAEAVLLIVGLHPRRDLLTAPMKTDFGTIYTEPDRAVLFPQIISFMMSHTRNGKDILVLPESPSLYFFSGMQSPSLWYEAQPGVLNPEQELTLINEANSAHVEYVLLCNRHVGEFGVAPFGIGYDQSISKWIIANYTKIGQFGPRADLLPPNSDPKVYQPYIMEVYERKSKK
jgi:hypothetical protein